MTERHGIFDGANEGWVNYDFGPPFDVPEFIVIRWPGSEFHYRYDGDASFFCDDDGAPIKVIPVSFQTPHQAPQP